jgi:hypothetical protein
LCIKLCPTLDAPPNKPPRHTFRQATPNDLAVLMRLYDEAAGDLSTTAVRDEASWSYLLSLSLQTEAVAGTWLALDEAGQPAGYFRIPQRDLDEGLIVNEVSRLSSDTALTILRRLKVLAVERDKSYTWLSNVSVWAE